MPYSDIPRAGPDDMPRAKQYHLPEEKLKEISSKHPLFVNNDPPQPADEACLRALVHKEQPRLEELAARLTQLKREHAKLEELTRLRRSVISPVRRLPAEVIREIIIRAMEIDPQHASVFASGVKVGPWHYTEVCRSWRSAVHKSPSLWTRLHIDGRDHVRVSAIKFALKRSKNLPLTIKMVFHSPLNNRMQDTLELLFQHSVRWRDVQIKTSFTQPVIKTFKVLKGNLPLLRSLDITHVRPGAGKPQFPTQILDSFILKAPNLRRLALRPHGVPLPTITSLKKVPWSDLECFTAHTEKLYEESRYHRFHKETPDVPQYNPRIMLKWLKRMDSVTELHVPAACAALLAGDEDVIEVSSLRRATFASAEILPALVLPSLESVELNFGAEHPKPEPAEVDVDTDDDSEEESSGSEEGTGSEGSDSESELESESVPMLPESDKKLAVEFPLLVERSSPPLQRVILTEMPSNYSILDVLRKLPPSVKYLTVTPCYYEETLFSTLTIPAARARKGSRSHSSLVLPQLEDLWLELREVPRSVDTKALLRMIQSRWKSAQEDVGSLQNVHICGYMQEEESYTSSEGRDAAGLPSIKPELLAPMEKEGLGITLRDRPRL
jgi:hypothetical protein